MVFRLIALLLVALLVTIVHAQVPDQVSLPTLDSVTGSTLTFSWTTPNDNGATITGYRIRMSPDQTFGFLWEEDTTTTATTRLVEDLDPGTDYYVTVTALSNNGAGAESAKAGPFTTQKRKPAAPVAAPGFVSRTAFQVTVSYTAPAANDAALDDATVTGYRVRVSDSPAMTGAVAHDDVYTNVANAPEARQLAITGLTPNTAYYFTLTLLTNSPASEENSDPSPASSAYTTLGQPVRPEAPAVSGTTATTLTVKFNETDPNGATIIGYRVRVAESSSGPFTPHAITDPGTFERTFTALTPNTDYFFDVTALVLATTGADSQSSPVSPAARTLPRPAKPAPPRPSRDPTLRTSTTVGVDFSATAGNGATISGYKLRLTRVSDNAQLFIDDITDTTVSQQFTGLVAATAYTAAVQAKVADTLVAEFSEFSDESPIQLRTLDTGSFANSFSTGPSVPALPPRTLEVLADTAITRGITNDQVTFDMHALNTGKLWAVLLTSATFGTSAPTPASVKGGNDAVCLVANQDVTAATLQQFRLSSCGSLTAGTGNYKLVVYLESAAAAAGELFSRDILVPTNYLVTTPTRAYTASTLSVTFQTATTSGLTFGMMVPAARADRVQYADLVSQTFEGVAVGACGWSNVGLLAAGQDNTRVLSGCASQTPGTLYSIVIMIRGVAGDATDYTLAFVQHRVPSNLLATAVLSASFTPTFAIGTFDYDVGNVAAVNNTLNITVTCDPVAVLRVGLKDLETSTTSGTKRSLALATGQNTVRALVTTVGITKTYKWTVFVQPPTSSFDAADMEWQVTTASASTSDAFKSAFAAEVAAVLVAASFSVLQSQVAVTSVVVGSPSVVSFRVNPPVPPRSLTGWSGTAIRNSLSGAYGSYTGAILSTLVTPQGTGEVKSSIAAVDLCAVPTVWRLLGGCSASEDLYCFTNACQNNGGCKIDVPTNNVLCTCTNGFFGSFCETQIGVIAAGSLSLNGTSTTTVNLNATATETVGTKTSSGMLVVADTLVRFRARLRGSRSLAVKFGPSTDRQKFTCTLAQTPALLGAANEPSTAIEAQEESVVVCSVGNVAYGGDMAFTLLLDDTRYTSPASLFTVGASLSGSEGNLIRFPRPVLTPKTLAIDGKSPVVLNQDNFATATGNSLLGDTLVFSGQYFAATTDMKVRFVNQVSTVQCAVNVVRTTSSQVVCDLGSGQGANYRFVVDYGQESQQSLDVFDYPVPPTVTSVEGCTTVGNTATKCRTHALTDANEPIVITVNGQKLFDPISVTVGGSECTGVAFVLLGTRITCRLPVGAGFRQLVSVVSRGLISDPVPYVSYDRPSFTSVVGCTADPSRAAGRGVHLCERTGGDLLTINGRNFGPRTPFVLVGSSICSQVVTLSAHFSVRCKLPSGTALGRVVLLVQDAGEVNTDTAQTRSTVSYTQCQPGTRNNGLACTNCTIGEITSVPSQNQCQKCKVGEYQPMPGMSSCFDCPAGKFQDAQGAGGCIDCKPGSSNNARGQGVCPVCLGGEFSNTTSALTCSPCLAGSYSSDNSTRCEQCTAGKFAPTDRSKECLDTPPGSFSNIQGSKVATLCGLGQFQSAKNSTKCLLCPPGKYSNVLGREQCFDCKDQQYQDESGKTFCKSCAVDGVVCTPTSVRTRDNYWMHREPREVFSFACPEGICTGENECAANRQPFDTNPMCGFCLNKYGEWGGLCVWCDGWHIEYIVLYFLQLFLLVWIIHRIMQPDEHDSRHFTSENVLKVFFYFIQVALVIVGQALPKGLYWLHYFMLNIGKATAAWNVCYGQLSGLALITLETLTPALLWGALAVIMAVYRLIHEVEQRRREKDGRHRKKFRRTPFTLTALYLYLLSYQLVAGAVFRYFDCVNVLGENVIFTAPSVSCDSDAYKSLQVIFTLVAIFWVGLLPLGMIMIMIYYTHGENDIRINKLVYELVSKKLMLLYGSWHSNAYFWEGVILLRRLLYAGFDVVYAAQLENKFLAFVLISLASVTHHYVIRPPKPVEMKKNRPTREQLRELRQTTHRRASEASLGVNAAAAAAAAAAASGSDGEAAAGGGGRRRMSLGRRMSRVFVSKARERSVSRDWSNMTGSFASLAMLQMRSSKGDEVVNNLLRPQANEHGMEMETYDDDEDNMDEYKYDDDVHGTGGGDEGKDQQMLPAWYDDEVARESQKQEYIIQIQRLNREIRRIENGGQFEAPMPVRLAVPRMFSDRDSFLFGTRIVHLAIERDQLMVRVGGGYRREEDFLKRWAHQEARALGVSEADVAHAITKIEFSKDAAEDEVKRKLKKLARGRFMRRHALLERLHAEVDQRERQIDDLDSVDLRVKYKEEAERKAAEERRRRREKRRREEAEKRRLEHEQRLRELAKQEEAWDKEWEDHWRKHRLVGIRAHKSHGPFRRPMENYLETASLAFLLVLAVLRTAFRPPMPLFLVVIMSFLVVSVATTFLLLAARRRLAVVYNWIMKKYDAYKRRKRHTGDERANLEMQNLGGGERSRRSSFAGAVALTASSSSPAIGGGSDEAAPSSAVTTAVSLFGGSIGRASSASVASQQASSVSTPLPESIPEDQRENDNDGGGGGDDDDDDDDDDESDQSSASDPSESLPPIPTDEAPADDMSSALGAVAAAYSSSSSSSSKKKKKSGGVSSRQIQTPQKRRKKKGTGKKKKKSTASTSTAANENFLDPPVGPSFKNEQGMSVNLPPPGTVSQFDDYIRMLHQEEGQQPLMRLPTALGGRFVGPAATGAAETDDNTTTAATMVSGTRAADVESGGTGGRRRLSRDSPRKMSMAHDEFFFQQPSAARPSRRRSASGDELMISGDGDASPNRRGSFDEFVEAMRTKEQAKLKKAGTKVGTKKKKKKVKRKLRTRSGSKMALMEAKYDGDDAHGYDSDPEVVGERDTGPADGSGDDGDANISDGGYHSDPETGGEPGMPATLKKKWSKRASKKTVTKKNKTKKKGKVSSSKKKKDADADDDAMSSPRHFGSSAQLRAMGVSIPPPPPGESEGMRRMDTFEAIDAPARQPKEADTFESLPESILKPAKVSDDDDDDDGSGGDADQKEAAVVADYGSQMSGRRRIRFEKPLATEDEPPIPPGQLTASKSLSSVDRLLAMTPMVSTAAPSNSGSRRMSAPSVPPNTGPLSARTAAPAVAPATSTGPAAPSSARRASAIDRLMALSDRLHGSVEKKSS